MANRDEKYMERCLFLAEKGAGKVAPNPMVGCVIVHEDKIIGEGYHEFFGGPHAEVNAVNSVADPSLLKEATFYVSLEPCAHYGKTPPCALLLSEIKPKKVLIACRDTFDAVDGKGTQMLKDAGVEVEIGLLEKQAQYLNRRFFTFHQYKRPFITLKWAQSTDGFIGQLSGEQVKISNKACDLYTQYRRSIEAGVLVGSNTLKNDKPRLNSRLQEHDLIRIAKDHREGIALTDPFLNGEQKSILYTSNTYPEIEGLSLVPGADNWPSILEDLYAKGVLSIIVEGGAQVLNYFIAHELYDEIFFYVNPELQLSQGVAAPHWPKKDYEVTEMQGDLKYSWERYGRD